MLSPVTKQQSVVIQMLLLYASGNFDIDYLPEKFRSKSCIFHAIFFSSKCSECEIYVVHIARYVNYIDP